MKTIKPIKITSKLMDHPVEKLTSAEMGKLWAVYMGNTMSKCVLSYYLQHVNDKEIKEILKNALNLSKEFLRDIKKIFDSENFPIPIGFTEDDVNLGAPRLFADEFYLHYLKYAAKAGLSLYSTAIPLMLRQDVRDFILKCNQLTTDLLVNLNDTLKEKGFLTRPPVIPVPEKVEFIQKESYFNGFLGHVRPLHGLEIAHLYDNMENNSTSKVLLMAFGQVAKNEKVKNFMHRGKEITMKHIEACRHQLNNEDLPAHPLLDDLAENSTFAPFSDKLMLFHKIDMFSMKIRSYANASSLNGRHDIGAMYSKFLLDIGLYVQDGAKIFIDEGWMEKPPQAVDRDSISSTK
ncbi:hypothetical protein F4694_000747 [Bacillus niacini]|uniref:DUF3231 family protein n=1 Tax=Neobacillus niacini TaxID=86668 RepID=A0A852T5W7_9BACI|nr:DUF3231 family protein [Neobacillus niacini]NYE04003.1 hypothetical protein [Neobacillus niacini]